ncbi:MAG: cytochrome c maturation protein CcmE [Rhodobacteraceae bacterium]|nr:cytochrome c maturation protein CcmE [Paracoccaceae bacterium]
MAGLKKKRRIQMVVAGLVLMASAAVLMGFAFKEGIEFFRTPSQVAEDMPLASERFRLGGLIKEGSWEKGDTHRFVVTDIEQDITVVYKGILPDLFDEGQMTIATGVLINDEFIASEVLAKHDEEYIPAELIDELPPEMIEALRNQGATIEPAS